MNVGDYVRTKDGLIAKYIGIDEEYKWHLFDNKIQWSYEYYTKEIDFEDWKEFIEEDVVKTSPNIIDLIEVGDYVNGFEVLRVDKECNLYPKTLKCQYPNNTDYFDVFNEDIKSIVTREQFSQMEYKVGE